MSRAPKLAALVDAAFDLRWTIDPVAASAQGLTAYDHRLGLYGEEDVREYVAALKAESGALEAYEPATLQDQIDCTALLGDTRFLIHRFERERQHVRSPAFWLSQLFEGLHQLLALPGRTDQHRREAARSRLGEVPGFLTLARVTLRDCPRVYVESGGHIAEGGAGLLDEMGALARDDPTFQQVLSDAREALTDFARYLRDDLLPNAGDDFAIGEEWFEFRLHYQHALRQSADELWRYGHELMEQTEHELEALARQIDSGAPWPDIADRIRGDHPTVQGLVPSYAEEMERARRFVEERGLAPIPEGRLEVIATPRFLRPMTPFAAYQPPGAFASERTGWFYVTPPDDHSDPERVEQVLRDHCVHDIPSTALHEGYPGHHLQFLHALNQSRLVRKLIGSAVSIEGWALYCEDMMAEEGFYTSPEQRLFQRVALLWRAVRVVADVGLHTRGMTFDEAVDLLVSRIHFDRTHAQAEVRRYCAEPCYQLSYAVGRRELKRLRDAYRAAAGGDYSLRGFHERILAYGGLPVSLIRWGLGLDE